LPFHGDRLHCCRRHCTHQIQNTHFGANSNPPPQGCSSAIIGASQSPSALLGLDLRPSYSFCITISTPLDHPTQHQTLLISWWRTFFPPEFIILPFKLHFDSPQANLNSNPFRYHKSSQTTLEFNFTQSPDPNHSEIQGAPPAFLRHG